jgi:protein SCO1/2
MNTPRIQHILFIFVLGLIIALSWFVFIWDIDNQQSERRLHNIAMKTAPIGGDFTLQSATGDVSLHDFQDKVVLLYFGYRSCPDICPTSLSSLSLALQALTPEEKSSTQTLFVSVDPERDSPELLKDYVDYFRANMLGLTGSPETLNEIASRYGVAYRKVESDSALGYLVDHSANIYLIDRHGKLQESLPHGTSPDTMVKSIRHYL